MFHIDGDFGQVRKVSSIMPDEGETGLFSFSGAGWHRCNRLYQIKRDHGAEDELILITLSGKGRVQIDCQEFEAGPNSVMILPSCVSHEYGTKGPELWEFYWIHLSKNLNKLFLDFIIKKYGYQLHFKSVDYFADRVEELLLKKQIEMSRNPVANSYIISRILHRLVLSQEEADLPENPGSVAMQVIRIIEKGYREPLSLEKIAQTLFLSKAQVIRVFKSYTGYTPYYFLEHYRMIRASELLEYTAMPVSAISQDVGYASPSHFISVFKAKYKRTPNQYRKERR